MYSNNHYAFSQGQRSPSGQREKTFVKRPVRTIAERQASAISRLGVRAPNPQANKQRFMPSLAEMQMHGDMFAYSERDACAHQNLPIKPRRRAALPPTAAR